MFRADTDDVSLPERFAEQARILEDRAISATSAPVLEIKEDGLELLKRVPSGTIGPWNLYSFFRNPVNGNCCAFRIDDVLAVGGYPTRMAEMEDYCLWIKMLIHGKRIFGSRAPLLRADARSLAARRGGRDWFLAEVAILRLNARRLAYVGSVPAITAFAFRAPLGFSAAEKLREILYQYFLRKRVRS